MTKIYIDINIFFNVWNEEIYPKSRDVLEKTEQKEFDAITSITTIMEIVHAFRVRGKSYNEAIDDIKRLNVKINAHDSWVMIKALEYQMEYELDPYDPIAFAVAQTAGCQIFVTRDEKIISILQDIFVFFWHENFHRFCKALAEPNFETFFYVDSVFLNTTDG